MTTSNNNINSTSIDDVFLELSTPKVQMTPNNNNSVGSAGINSTLAGLSVKYDDPSVLTTKSKELEIVDKYFSSITCNDKQVETLLYEIIGYSLTRTAKLNKAFIFIGKGRNGKSCIARILECLLGMHQCSHEHLEKLSGSKAGSKTSVMSLNECTVNIAEDQKSVKYVNTSILTRLISGEPISVEQKGGDKEVLIPYATLLFTVNEVIDFKETGIYITDRFVVIPFSATFTDTNNNRDINIVEELCKPLALQIIATRAVQAFTKVLENGKFTIPPIVEQATNKYFLECNNVAEFCGLFPLKTIITKSQYYEEYCNWCKDNNREAVSNSQFGKEVLALGYRAERYSFGNKRNTYYANSDFDNSKSRAIYENYLKYMGITEEADINYNNDKTLYSCGKTFNEYLIDCLYDRIVENDK